MGERWLISEFPGDVAALTAVAQPGDHWLATTPTAMDECEAAQRASTLDGEVAAPEQLNALGRANFSLADALTVRYDQAILQRCPELQELGLRPFRGHFHRIKLFLDAVTSRLQILQSLSAGAGEAFLKVRARCSVTPLDADLFYRIDASLYEGLLEVLAAQGKAEIGWVSRTAERPIASRRWSRLPMRHLAAWLRGVTRLATHRPNGHAHQRMLVLGVGYDLRYILRMCRALGVESFWLDLARLQLRRFPWWEVCRVDGVRDTELLQTALERLELFGTGDAAEELCRMGEVSYAPIVRRGLAHYLKAGLPQAIATRSFLEAAHRQFHFDLLLSPAGPERIVTRTVFDFCQQQGMPVAVMQHGAYGYADNPVTNYYEFGFDGDFLAWGAGVEAQYEPTKRGAVRFVPVGSPSLEQIVARRHRTASKPDRIMYITTDLRGSSAYFPGGQPWLDTSYYRFQQAVLKVLGKYQDRYDLWLKMPPVEENLARNPIRGWLQANGLRVSVESRPLVRVIEQPSLFLIDFPSTTLLQCLGTRAELIVFTGSPYFTVLPPARTLLEQRAICCDSPQAFLNAVERTCARGVRPRDVVDDGFLSRYGTFLHDGGSLGRIRGYLEERGIADPGRTAATPDRVVWQAS